MIFIRQRGTLKVDPFMSCPEIDEFTARSAHLIMANPATSAASAAATSGCRDRYTRAGWALAADQHGPKRRRRCRFPPRAGIANLALPLLRDDPEGIRAMVLDGGVPPADPIGGSGRRRRAAGYQALFYACAREPKCHRTCPTSSTVTFDSQVNRGDV